MQVSRQCVESELEQLRPCGIEMEMLVWTQWDEKYQRDAGLKDPMLESHV